jgi:cytidine deaminase
MENSMTFEELYRQAQSAAHPHSISETGEIGRVGAALLTGKGSVHIGVSIDLSCSLGFCAEQSAAAAMLTAGETHVVRMIAVDQSGRILPPCGRCREFVIRLNPLNARTEIMVGAGKIKELGDLLPDDWLGTSSAGR